MKQINKKSAVKTRNNQSIQYKISKKLLINEVTTIQAYPNAPIEK
jgi:hypothetical protein